MRTGRNSPTLSASGSLTSRSGVKSFSTAAQSKAGAVAALAWLKRRGRQRVLDGMARYGLPSAGALGVGVGEVQRYGRQLGRSQRLAEALWDTGVYEARLLASFVGEPARLTRAGMNRWCRDFDNWGVVDTVCFKLFDQSPHAWALVEPWAKQPGEFQRRAGFVLLACLAGHDRTATDEDFLRFLPLIEEGAGDARNFVRKGVSWALRMIGRRNPVLKTAARAVALRLSGSDQPAARWVGQDALRQFNKK